MSPTSYRTAPPRATEEINRSTSRAFDRYRTYMHGQPQLSSTGRTERRRSNAFPLSRDLNHECISRELCDRRRPGRGLRIVKVHIAHRAIAGVNCRTSVRDAAVHRQMLACWLVNVRARRARCRRSTRSSTLANRNGNQWNDHSNPLGNRGSTTCQRFGRFDVFTFGAGSIVQRRYESGSYCATHSLVDDHRFARRAARHLPLHRRMASDDGAERRPDMVDDS